MEARGREDSEEDSEGREGLEEDSEGREGLEEEDRVQESRGLRVSRRKGTLTEIFNQLYFETHGRSEKSVRIFDIKKEMTFLGRG